MEKVGSGMASLEALTSKLKMSFNDDAVEDEAKVQTNLEQAPTPAVNTTTAVAEVKAE